MALFLVLTMAPFVLLAPLIGPLLDRFRHGRRWALGTTLAMLPSLAWVLASAVVEDSAWLFPAALGCLVASRTYAVARAAAVPRLLPPGITLVTANSRLTIAGLVGMALGGGLAGALSRIGPDWSLRLAFVVYVVATVLAIRPPAPVDSTAGEHDVDGTPVGEAPLPSPQRGARRLRALPRGVRDVLWLATGARLLSGFLTLFLGFLMREHPLPGWSGPTVLALVIGAAGVGNALGSVIGNRRGGPEPERLATGVAALAVVSALLTAVLYSLPTLVLLGLATGPTASSPSSASTPSSSATSTTTCGRASSRGRRPSSRPAGSSAAASASSCRCGPGSASPSSPPSSSGRPWSPCARAVWGHGHRGGVPTRRPGAVSDVPPEGRR